MRTEPQRTDVDGTPVFWAPHHSADGTVTLRLRFRHGAADGTPETARLLALAVELLATAASREAAATGSVGPYLSTLEITGERERVLGALGRAVAWLWQPDLDHLSGAVDALAGTRRARRTGTLAGMLHQHFGLRGPGLLAATVGGWARPIDRAELLTLVHRDLLTCSRAAALTFAPTADLRIPVPRAEREGVAPTDLQPTGAGVTTLGAESVPGVSLLVQRDWRSPLLAELLEAHAAERLAEAGLGVHRVTAGALAASRDLSMLHATVDAPAAQARAAGTALLRAVDDLASGSRPDLVRSLRKRWTETLDTPFWAPMWARTCADQVLLGERPTPAIARTARLRGFTEESIAETVCAGLRSVHLTTGSLPERAAAPAWCAG